MRHVAVTLALLGTLVGCASHRPSPEVIDAYELDCLRRGVYVHELPPCVAELVKNNPPPRRVRVRGTIPEDFQPRRSVLCQSLGGGMVICN